MPALYPAFFFVLEKAVKSAGNAVISTLLMHRSHGLQHLRHKRPTFAFVGESGYTRHPSPEPRTQRLTRRNRWRFGWGWYHYPRSVPHVSETLRGRGLKRQTLPLWGLGRGCSRRTQRAFGTAMRLCASLFRGVAAPLGCVICLQLGDVAVFSLCAQYFLNVRDTGGITTLGVLCMLPKCRTAACQSGLFVVFLRPLFTFAKAPAGHCQYPHRYRLPAAQSPADKPPALD